MACCGLGPTFEAACQLNAGANDTILVTGLGPVGLGAIICCTFRGSRVIGVSRNQYRRELALQIGAEAVADPSLPGIIEKILDLTNGKGVDKVIECTGDATHQQLAIKTAKRKGQVAFIGESNALTLDVSNDLLRKGLTLHGIWHWNINNYQQLTDTIRASKQKIQKIITHTFALENVEEAFRVQLTANCGKVILRP
jgi:L-iditol 2-dehydrogenase